MVSWNPRIDGVRAAGAITQPTRQPVAFPVFEIEFTTIVRARMPGSAARLSCRCPSENDVLVDFVGDHEQVVPRSEVSDPG